MNTAYREHDLVIHLDRPDWGAGTVMALDETREVMVSFAGQVGWYPATDLDLVRFGPREEEDDQTLWESLDLLLAELPADDRPVFVSIMLLISRGNPDDLVLTRRWVEAEGARS